MDHPKLNVMKTFPHFNFSFVIFLFLPFFLFSLELKKREISLGGQVLVVEIADTVEAHARGLMGRANLSDGEGMLFIYPKPALKSFWMKNTWIPLSLGYFDADKKLIHIADMDPPSDVFASHQLPSYISPAPVLYALEVPQGWFQKKQVRLGAKFSFLDPE